MSIFSVVQDTAASTEELNNGLRNISKWACQWKMRFNSDLTEQAQEVIFSRKLNKPADPNLTFNNSQVSQTESQEYLNFRQKTKLLKSEHLKSVFDKISKTISLIRKFQAILARFSSPSIYKTFVRPHLDYEDIVYYQTYNASFESFQYSACLTITGTIRYPSQLKSRIRLGDLEDGLGSYVCSTKLSIINYLLSCYTIFPVLR